MKLRAYECRVKGVEYGGATGTVVHHISSAKARYSYLLQVRECYPDIGFAQIWCRSLGAPRNTAQIENVARIRNRPPGRGRCHREGPNVACDQRGTGQRPGEVPDRPEGEGVDLIPKKPEVLTATVRHDRYGNIRYRVCGCTYRESCDPPCSWAEGEADLRSNCLAAVMVLVCWFEGAHHPNWAALKREAEQEKRRWVESGRTTFGHHLKVTFTKEASR